MFEVTKKLFLATAVVFFFLAGCALPPTIKDASELAANTKVVFGSVEVFEDGEQVKWGMRWTGTSYFYLTILPAHTSEAITYQLDSDGVFYWALQPGNYTLLGYYWLDSGIQRTGYIGAKFIVPETGKDTYLGSIEFQGSAAYLAPQFKDRYDEIVKLYDAKFQSRKGTADKQLFEPPQPVGDFSSFRGICHDDWKITCDKRFRGVTPLSPEVARTGFPLLNSLVPEFRWEPAGRQDISYDLIVYEAAVYAVKGAVSSSYMRGRVVAYEENLKEPRWLPEEPLKPDTRYFWSVRLREGETVSEWSTHGHFMFLIVAMSSSYGQWFQFKTP